MDDTTKEKLNINLANAWKMWSNRATVGVGALWTAFFTLPVACAPSGIACGTTQHDVQVWFSQSLHVPLAVIATIATVLTVLARVWPQKNITPTVAAAKSEDAAQPPETPQA